MNNEYDIFYAESQMHWRQWLVENHQQKNTIWLKCFKLKSGVPTLTWSEAVDEALCFGWIDSTRRTLDEQSFIQLFSKRKSGSTWSKINKDKVEQLIASGSMTDAGLAVIERAKKNGSWTILDEVEALILPDDLEHALLLSPGTKEYYLGLSKSQKKMVLHRLVMAKQLETRKKRIKEIIAEFNSKLEP